MRSIRFIATVVGSMALAGCLTWFGVGGGYDDRSITVQTLSLSTQHEQPQAVESSWRGDWIFRRFRLALIDQELRESKPEILILQDVMARHGSTAESDRNILSAGALSGYEWGDQSVAEFEDTSEEQNMAVAVGLPLRIINRNFNGARTYWAVGNDGYMTLTLVDLEDQIIPIFNVKMPAKTSENFLWYTFIQDRIYEIVKKNRLCPKRLIVAGYLPGDQSAKRINDFMTLLQLKDSGKGFCQIASKCYTATTDNEMFNLVAPDEVPSQADHILVSADTNVFSAGTIYTQSDANVSYVERYGLKKLWASARFGWGTTLRMPRCGDGDYWQ